MNNKFLNIKEQSLLLFVLTAVKLACSHWEMFNENIGMHVGSKICRSLGK